MYTFTYIFEPKVVIAVSIKGSLFFRSTGKLSDILSMCSIAILAASSKPSEIRIGWRPQSNNCSACSSKAPAKTERQMNQILGGHHYLDLGGGIFQG